VSHKHLAAILKLLTFFAHPPHWETIWDEKDSNKKCVCVKIMDSAPQFSLDSNSFKIQDEKAF
jgi:hypothetical protein